MTCALLRAESLMFKFPVSDPVAAGAKITSMVQLLPVSSVLGQVLVSEKSIASGPARDAAHATTGARHPGHPAGRSALDRRFQMAPEPAVEPDAL